jgi:hypothetical protein
MVGRLGMGQPCYLISPTDFSVVELARRERRLPRAGLGSFPSSVVVKSSQVTRQAPLVSAHLTDYLFYNGLCKRLRRRAGFIPCMS